MNAQLIQWNKFGDYPLVTKEHCSEFEYTEAAYDGAGFINKFTIVYPGSYIVEINGVYVSVISEKKANEILKKELNL